MIYLVAVLCLLTIPLPDSTEVLGRVYFDMDAGTLSPSSKALLKMVAEVLHERPNLMIDISGHTDNTGSPSANLTISKNMADSVKDYLMDNFNIAGERIMTTGLGSKNPIASNETEYGRAENRRVEILIRQPEAILTWFENDVKVQPSALRPDWLDPVPNYYLYLGYRVTTGKKSSAHILYPNKGTLKIAEDAMVIIHGLNLEKQEDSFIKNIALQDGGLKAILEDAASQDDSVMSTPATMDESNSLSSKTLVDEKLEDLIVAYQTDTEASAPCENMTGNKNEGVVVDRDTDAGMPAGFGLGVIIGEPTGISFKKWIAGKHAIDFEMGWSFPGDRIHIAVDYLTHFPEWIRKHNLHPYLGVGGRLKMKAEQEEEQFTFGIRFGAGIEYIRGQFGLYGELYPVVDLVPETKFGMEGGIGARYYFKD